MSADDRATPRIVRVDRPLPGLFALTMSRSSGREVLLIAAGPPRTRCAWALVPERPRGEPADAAVRVLRQAIEGAEITGMFDGRGLALRLERGGERTLLVADARRGLAHGAEVGVEVPHGEPVDDETLVRARGRGDGFVTEHELLLAEDARRAARSALARARARLERRADAIRGDRRAVEEAEAAAARARVFVPAAARASRGATSLEAVDYATGEPVRVSFPLSPDRGAREQLEALFARAKRLRAGQRVADRRLADAEAGIAAIALADAELSSVSTRDEASALLVRVQASLPRDVLRPPQGMSAARGPAPSALPRGVREFVATSGALILVGRDATANDRLTLDVGRPGDLWLHAREAAGAHVLVPRWYRGGRMDGETLVDAATLAAHFSDSRGEVVVEVAYTDRRFVKKPRGAPAGAVTLLEERVLPLRLEPARLARLLRE